MQDFKNWFRAASIRAVRTMSQTAAALISTKAVLSDVDWKVVISAVALSGILSVLTAISGLPECNQED